MNAPERRVRLPLLAMALLAGAARAQEGDRVVVETRVTAVSATGLYLDRGSDAGLQPGDRVELFPDAAPRVLAVVRVVSRQSARAEWSGDPEGVSLGTRAEITIPSARLARAADGAERPPWERSVDGFDRAQPLLAPDRGAAPEEDPFRISGRTFARVDHTWDAEARRRYLLARTGVDLELENVFGRRGALVFDGEVFHRRATVPGASDDLETRQRIDRLSYHAGDEAGAPVRYEVGRFLQHEFPEFGVIDGAEITFRPDARNRIGASVGLLPDFTPELDTGEDLQGAVFFRHLFDEDESASLGAGFQKTLHRGDADRDLFLLSGRSFTPGGLTLTGTAWVDLYTESDRTKPEGPELTQLWLNASHPIGASSGVGAFLSHVRFPETKHAELPPLPAARLADARVTRAGLTGWHRLTEKLRLDGRADRWIDEDDDGGSGELRASLRDPILPRSQVSAALFASEGKFTSLTGARFGVTQGTGVGVLGLHYDVTRNAHAGAPGIDATLVQQALRGSFDLETARSWSVSVYAESRFGDSQGSVAAGFLLSIRF